MEKKNTGFYTYNINTRIYGQLRGLAANDDDV